MLYKCVECDREIASDARFCPSCGTRDAGERALSSWLYIEAEKKDPGCHERASLERQAQIKAAEAKAKKERENMEQEEEQRKINEANRVNDFFKGCTAVAFVIGFMIWLTKFGGGEFLVLTFKKILGM